MEKILDTQIKSDNKYIFFCKREDNGNIAIYRAVRGKQAKKVK